MAVSNTNTGFMNPDGLRMKFPQDLLVKTIGGEYSQTTSTHTHEFDLTFTLVNLGAAATPWIVDYDSVFKDGGVIDKVELKIGSAWTAGGAATFNVGLVTRSDFTTIVSATGIVNAVAVATMTAGTILTIVAGGTGAGALLGTALAADDVLAVHVATGPFLTGTMKMYIHWRPTL